MISLHNPVDFASREGEPIHENDTLFHTHTIYFSDLRVFAEQFCPSSSTNDTVNLFSSN